MDVIQLRAEVSNLKGMLEDALLEASVFNQKGDYAQLEECSIRITHLSNQVQLREKHLRDHINFNNVIKDLNNRGIICEVVKRVELQRAY